MRLHVIEHVPYEGPGAIATWAESRGHAVTESLALTEVFPLLPDVDFVVVMGGPM
ncbi:MAG: amidotransferase, partial [Actinobacteria bacterium]